MLLLPLGHPRERQGILPHFSSLQSYASITKSVEQVNTPGRTSEIMRRAFAALRQGRPGPVAVEIPADVALEDVSEESFYYTPSRRVAAQGDPGDVEAAARALCSASNPIILAGQGVMYAKATDEPARTGRVAPSACRHHFAGQERLLRESPAGPRFGGAHFVVDSGQFHPSVGPDIRCRHKLSHGTTWS